jgi:hypothetical protein
MKMFLLMISFIGVVSSNQAQAFCGFYVAKADTSLFNKASKVVLVRDDNKTVITMASDYKGAAKDFALVVPVPTVLKRKQINVGNPKVINHIDSYTSPRLVEYFDSDPCQTRYQLDSSASSFGRGAPVPESSARPVKKNYKVKIEAKYQVGEYDILILSAKESDGLSRWLKDNGYKTPKKAEPILKSYVKRGLKFFVAKVNLKRHSKNGGEFLKPLQIAFESRKFELPIRLGTVNSNGPQDLFVFALTKKGRVESVNYQTRKIPSGQNIPVFLKNEFDDFYKDLFSNSVKKDKMKTVFLEYAWDMGWCDPCAADPLSTEELKSLGVWWLGESYEQKNIRARPGGIQNVFVTRLHMRYTAKSFPSDLNLQVTNDRNNFQGKYVMTHLYKGEGSCKELKAYRKSIPNKLEKEAQNLASLTGRNITSVRQKMKIASPKEKESNWIDNLWK